MPVGVIRRAFCVRVTGQGVKTTTRTPGLTRSLGATLLGSGTRPEYVMASADDRGERHAPFSRGGFLMLWLRYSLGV